ncbi:hypothetical protein [Marinirhabdus gelatinilytica]|uniref:Lipoprotein n=1 Tax=Marinirhabdus gelatinilytica TaxID=1703343 RepID=A0A370QAR3_9FLAO|nr:hypothetical protein [Marinirhabdus gelatinilytica]RDK85442.1 hypothetical protein C8D94_103267 [Marinirhabdus gelatinilytica]
MKKALLLLALAVAFVSCNSVKRNQKYLLKGNYDQAIELAVKKISNDRYDEQIKEHIILLEEAYAKAVSQDNRRISALQGNATPEALRELYYVYKRLDNRQEAIRPLLPLKNVETGYNAHFPMVNYNQQLTQAKANFANSLYTEAKNFMARNTIMDFREAHSILSELKQLQSNYKDIDRLLDDAHFYGTDFVLVTLNNRSNMIIPRRLERELLDFNTYNLDDFWTVYHNERQRDIQYNYGIVLNFREIAFSPERISDKEFRRKKEIKTGWKYKLDRYGNKIKDEDGKFIKIDVFETVTARVTHTLQSKSILVGGDVIYRDLQSGRNIDSHPLSTEFIFENVFGKFRGDERALTREDKRLLNNDFVPFPNNAQMLLDAGEDIKGRLKEILSDNELR